MSAPETNVEKQERRHKPALLGILAAVVFAVIAIAGVAIFGLPASENEAASGDQQVVTDE